MTRTPPRGSSETERAVDAAWRIESARVVAALARMVRDLELAAAAAMTANDAERALLLDRSSACGARASDRAADA